MSVGDPQSLAGQRVTWLDKGVGTVIDVGPDFVEVLFDEDAADPEHRYLFANGFWRGLRLAEQLLTCPCCGKAA